ncbi:hypothetical protein Cantr_06748 [Candida viswanathii]|uniref:Aminopeptidase n=1 Tax=Candida viswanathii TaxID=5486 RepID=A0A367XX49_9ASCO|nr:hypothetical protein Cantr_06748 [Candida viswanathii]
MADSSIPLTLSNKYIPSEYHYKLNINHQKPNFSGSASITLTENKQHRSAGDDDEPGKGFRFTLHANRLVITTASIGEKKLKVEYDKPLQRVSFVSDEEITIDQPLEIKYMGQIKTINTYNDVTQGLFKTNFLDNDTGKSDNYILTTHFQPHGAKQVFPIIDELTTLKKFQVCCNGEEKDVVYSDETDNKTTQFVYEKPIHSAIMGFLIVKVHGVNDSVRVYAPNGDLSKTNLALSIIEDSILKDGVMENWSMISVIAPNLLVDDSAVTKQFKAQLTELIVHELVHQWIGNWVSFDNWNFLWFNESFATWAARKIIGTPFGYDSFLTVDCFFDGDFKIGSIYDYMQKVDSGLNSTTESIFSTEMYEKGMILLNMIDGVFTAEGKDMLSSFKSVFDIWQELNDQVSVDLPSFVYSWIRSKGYPILQVSHKGDKVVIEQHAYFLNLTVEGAKIEDAPYHVPLLVKARNDAGETKVLNLIMSDRSLELDISKLICVNSGHKGYYRVLYDRIDNLESWQRFGFAVSTSRDLRNFVKLFDGLLTLPWDWSVWECALGYLDPIVDILRHFTDFTKFEQWLSGFASKLFKQLKWDYEIPVRYSSLEWKVRSSILQLNVSNRDAYNVCHKYYQNFMNSGINKKFTPERSMKEYKRVLELVKNSNVSLLNQTNAARQELQTISLTSLSFVNDRELVNKTLNFINNNIDSKLIELGLIGFTFTNKHIDVVFNWFRLHYDNWIMRSLRKGSDWSKQIGITVKNIVKIMLKMMSNNKDNKFKMNEFVQVKSQTLPEHGLKELVETWELESEECFRIASFYDDWSDEI